MIVGRGVEKVEGRCGGQAVLVGTRLTIKCLDAMWRAGGDDYVAKEYPYLSREQRMAAYGYAEEHRAELDAEAAAEANEDMVVLDAEPIGGALEDVAQAGKALPITPHPRAPGTPHPWQESDDEIRAELAKAPVVGDDLLPCCGGALGHLLGCEGPGSPRDLFRRLERLQVEHDAMATAGRQAHDECVTAQRRAARAIAALRLLQSGLVSLPDKIQSAVSVALSDEPPPPRVSVRDIGVGGPYRLFVDDWGIATWPSKPALEDPHGYAEEVARCLRRALGVTDDV